MNLSELNNDIIAFLRTYITHPDPAHEATENWIYMDYPRLDIKNFPRISVTQTGGSGSQVGIGEQATSEEQGQYLTFGYDIDIWVKKGNVFSFGTPAIKLGGSALRDYLADLVVAEIFEYKQSIWKDTKGVIDITLDGISTSPFDEDFELFRKTLSFTFTVYRSY